MGFTEVRAALDATEQEYVAQINNLTQQVFTERQRGDQLMTQRDNAVNAYDTLRAEYDAHMSSAHPTTPPPDPEPTTPKVIIGMSAPRDQWAQRVQEVGGAGKLGARRIFADLVAGGRSQAELIEAAIDDGLIPVVSYKGSPLTQTAALADTAAYLKGLGTLVYATFWHEPWGDFGGGTTTADYAPFRDGSKAFARACKSPTVKVAPLLNGWLLNNRRADFDKLVDAELLGLWDAIGIDTYEEGTITAPGEIKPASRIPLLVQWTKDKGIPNKPLIIGEYNGYSGATIAAAGEAIFDAAPQLVLACMWNSTEGKGYVLTGERLAAFKATLADPRRA